MTGSGASGMSSRDYMPIDVGIKREEDRFRVQGSEFQVWRGDMSLDLIFDICYLRFAICDLIFGIRTVTYHRMAQLYAAIIKMTNDK